jgi:DNA helicase-2/ATP-dependent DNA helicase PcrA
MEYDTPSRFIRDIDPSLLYVASGNRGEADEDFGTSRLPWTQRTSQNPHPVASQFRADPKPRAVAPRQEERPVNPFSDSFKRQLNQASGGRFKPVSRAVSSSPVSSSPSASGSNLREGMTIEHQRFGIGKVLKVEGTGENEKATIEFRNVGTKQLLLKFAKFTIV